MEKETLEEFLRRLGLEDEIDTLRREDIDFEALKIMTDSDLKEIGLLKGKRVKILKEIESMKNKDDEVTTAFPKQLSTKASVRGNKEKHRNDWLQDEIRLVLLEKTGSGKSATANTILGGGGAFESTISGSSVTSQCSKRHAERFGKRILIVDTPGIFDTSQSNEKIQDEIIKCISITSPGPHAFILVLTLSRHTEEEQKSVMHFVKHFGEGIYRYFIVLFTRKDDLDVEGRTLVQHITTVPPELRVFIQKCGGRVIAFNNRLEGAKKDAQVQELLSNVMENVDENGGQCYTNEMYLEAERLIKEREEEDLRKAKKEREKELREIEKSIEKKYEAKFAGEEEKLKKAQKKLDDLIRKYKKMKSRQNF